MQIRYTNQIQIGDVIRLHLAKGPMDLCVGQAVGNEDANLRHFMGTFQDPVSGFRGTARLQLVHIGNLSIELLSRGTASA